MHATFFRTRLARIVTLLLLCCSLVASAFLASPIRADVGSENHNVVAADGTADEGIPDPNVATAESDTADEATPAGGEADTSASDAPSTPEGSDSTTPATEAMGDANTPAVRNAPPADTVDGEWVDAADLKARMPKREDIPTPDPEPRRVGEIGGDGKAWLEVRRVSDGTSEFTYANGYPINDVSETDGYFANSVTYDIDLNFLASSEKRDLKIRVGSGHFTSCSSPSLATSNSTDECQVRLPSGSAGVFSSRVTVSDSDYGVVTRRTHRFTLTASNNSLDTIDVYEAYPVAIAPATNQTFSFRRFDCGQVYCLGFHQNMIVKNKHESEVTLPFFLDRSDYLYLPEIKYSIRVSKKIKQKLEFDTSLLPHASALTTSTGTKPSDTFTLDYQYTVYYIKLKAPLQVSAIHPDRTRIYALGVKKISFAIPTDITFFIPNAPLAPSPPLETYGDERKPRDPALVAANSKPSWIYVVLPLAPKLTSCDGAIVAPYIAQSTNDKRTDVTRNEDHVLSGYWGSSSLYLVGQKGAVRAKELSLYFDDVLTEPLRVSISTRPGTSRTSAIRYINLPPENHMMMYSGNPISTNVARVADDGSVVTLTLPPGKSHYSALVGFILGSPASLDPTYEYPSFYVRAGDTRCLSSNVYNMKKHTGISCRSGSLLEPADVRVLLLSDVKGHLSQDSPNVTYDISYLPQQISSVELSRESKKRGWSLAYPRVGTVRVSHDPKGGPPDELLLKARFTRQGINQTPRFSLDSGQASLSTDFGKQVIGGLESPSPTYCYPQIGPTVYSAVRGGGMLEPGKILEADIDVTDVSYPRGGEADNTAIESMVVFPHAASDDSALLKENEHSLKGVDVPLQSFHGDVWLESEPVVDSTGATQLYSTQVPTTLNPAAYEWKPWDEIADKSQIRLMKMIFPQEDIRNLRGAVASVKVKLATRGNKVGDTYHVWSGAPNFAGDDWNTNIAPPATFTVVNSSIAGTIVSDSDKDKAVSAPDSGLGGLTVTLSRDGAEIARTTTGNDGTYRFEHIPSGEYEVRLLLIDPEAVESFTHLGAVRVAVGENKEHVDAGYILPIPPLGSMPATGRIGVVGILLFGLALTISGLLAVSRKH